MTVPEREGWATALAAADQGAVTALADAISARAHVEAVVPISEGLMLLQLRDSVAGVRFHLGEIPVTTVHLRITEAARSAEGGATLMSDDIERTTRIAILDAVMAAGWPEADRIAELLIEGAAARARIEAERALVLNRTRVDFKLVSETANGNG
jgi:alpha-D-ribose 1-methylphosphonate 5-triphosphate synthase subunit PhnG